MFSPPCATISATTKTTSTTSPFSLLPADIIRAHILPTLDGCTLASVGCVTPELRSLSSDKELWSHICHSTWPSTTTPRLRHLISSFPGVGPRSFFSLSFPLFPPTLSPNPHPPSSSSLPEQLISAVDIFYRGECIFSKVQETETVTGWFRCSPLRVDLLGPKESVPTPIRRPSHDDTCQDLYADMELSWIVVDPAARRAVNLSTFRPVSVERHWLSGEVHVRYTAVVGGQVMCSVVVTCVGGGPGGGLVLHVTEACLKMEEIGGAHLNGKDSLVILQGLLQGKRENLCGKGGMKGRVEEGRRRYLEYLQRKRERREKMLRREGRLDNMCIGIGVLLFLALFYVICFSST